MLAAVIDGVNAGSGIDGTAQAPPASDETRPSHGTAQSQRLEPATVLSVMELCWGDVGLLLTMPRQGLGNSAIASVASEEQLERYGGAGQRWRSPSPRPARTLRRSARPRCSTVTEYVLNGEKIYVTSGERADLVVVWATLDRSAGPCGDQVVRRRAREPRPEARAAGAQAWHPRL